MEESDIEESGIEESDIEESGIEESDMEESERVLRDCKRMCRRRESCLQGENEAWRIRTRKRSEPTPEKVEQRE